MSTQDHSRRDFLRTIGIGATGLALAPDLLAADKNEKVNILWIYVEDTTPLMGCYGEALIKTPHIDQLAANGVRFDKAFMPAAVCSPVRSAIITGMMQTTLGIHNHRSSHGTDRIYLPKHIKTIPEMLREAGYYTLNTGKDDYNFVYDRKKLYSGQKDWRGRRPGQPFFAQLQLRGGKNRKKPRNPVDRASVKLPPYYPDHPVIREEWAWHLDCVMVTDDEVGQIVARLKKEGILNNTVIFFFSDHGMRLLRHKQFLYDGGLHVPLIVSWPGDPEWIKPGTVRKDLVSGIDIAATTLALAGIDVPDYMEARDLFSANYKERQYIIAARDRCDFTIDRIRAVRTQRYKYLRNFLTDRPYMQPQYRDGARYTKAMKQLHAQGKLTPAQARFMDKHRPAEELYDLQADPHETNNLADDPQYAQVLQRMSGILEKWIRDTDDKGQYPESKEGLRAVLKRWKSRAVNPEYDAARNDK